MVRLFDGDLTLGEILSMDIPSQKVMVQARLENLRRSQENYSKGQIDAYSRRYANTMAFGAPSSIYKDSESSPEEEQGNNTIDRSKSLNFHDR